MIATMTRPPIVLYRWVGHSLDVRAYLGGPEPLFNASDVCKALGLQLEFGEYDWVLDRAEIIWPLPVEHVDELLEKDGRPSAFFTVDQVRDLDDQRPMFDDDNDFRDWFETTLRAELAGDALAETIASVMPAGPSRASQLAARERQLLTGLTFPISKAAKILSQDPVLDYGQDALFDYLDGIGWIHKDRDVWVPAIEIIDAGYLVRDRVPVRGRRDLYPQVRVTEAGIREIHHRLGGIVHLTLEPAPALTLVEI